MIASTAIVKAAEQNMNEIIELKAQLAALTAELDKLNADRSNDSLNMNFEEIAHVERVYPEGDEPMTTTNGIIQWLCADWRTLNAANVRLTAALNEISRLAPQLPGGIYEDADPNDDRPDDMVSHVGGLIWQVAVKATVKENDA
jgi:hypothetical protein